jgi:carnitine O-acetyltransferase
LDRHLFGLKKCLREGEPLPEIYKDESFSKSNHWELSTSQLSSPYLEGWGYGEGMFPCSPPTCTRVYGKFLPFNEVVPDGYGLSYSIGNDYIRWTITSLKRRTAELKHHLAKAATEVKHMMERAEKAEKRKLEGKL